MKIMEGISKSLESIWFKEISNMDNPIKTYTVATAEFFYFFFKSMIITKPVKHQKTLHCRHIIVYEHYLPKTFLT